jgi:hypothetical protein
VSGIAALAASVVLASPASAGAGLCNSGYVCGYDLTNYDGRLFGTAQSSSNWHLQGAADMATSVSVNGASCRYAVFYTDWNAVSNTASGTTFQLNSRQLVGTDYRDANLANGAGNRLGVDLSNKVSWTKFTGC